MKIFILFTLLYLFNGYNPGDSSQKIDYPTTDTSISNRSVNSAQHDLVFTKHNEKRDTTSHRKTDTVLLMNVSEEILKLIKNRKYKDLTLFIHPKDGVRFSPYAYINTTENRVLSAEQFFQLVKQNKKINWNSSWDASEKPELLSIDGYFKKFVYDVDFLNAELKSIWF